MSKYVFKPYHPIFPELYERESKRLREFLGEGVVLEHFGSTAVPDLGGKGIIDIIIPAAREQLQPLSGIVQQAGYRFVESASYPHRLVHITDFEDPIEGERRYHLHVTDQESEDYINAILFRDFLRTHPGEREAYARIKEEAVNLNKTNKEEYMAHKGPLIAEIVRKAREQGEL